MSTSSPGSEDAFAYFYTTGIPELVAILVQIQGLAIKQRWFELRSAAGKITEGLLLDVNREAAQSASVATATVVRILIQSRRSNRPFTGDLEQHIVSLPGPLGTVRVGLVEELDKAVNPATGYGTFWRAQEFGTGTAEVPSQIGRVFRGTFSPSQTSPDSSMRGTGRGSDLVFISDVAGGLGTISVELPGRHFLTDGSAEAATHYIKAMEAVQVKWLPRIQELVKLAAGGVGGLTAVLHA